MKSILIVDAGQTGNMLESALTGQGYQCLVARDARTALSLLNNGTSMDLMVSETKLPDMDGMDFLLHLHRTMPELPVIIVTADCSVEKYLQAVNLGVVEYLAKPLFMKEFSRIVRFTLNQSATCDRLPGADRSITAASREGSWDHPREGG
jgi:DNA-binding NtrC family response regulator